MGAWVNRAIIHDLISSQVRLTGDGKVDAEYYSNLLKQHMDESHVMREAAAKAAVEAAKLFQGTNESQEDGYATVSFGGDYKKEELNNEEVLRREDGGRAASPAG